MEQTYFLLNLRAIVKQLDEMYFSKNKDQTRRQFSLCVTFFNIRSAPVRAIYSETSRLAGWLHLDISSLRRWLSLLINQCSSQTPPAKQELIWPNAGTAESAASHSWLFMAFFFIRKYSIGVQKLLLPSFALSVQSLTPRLWHVSQVVLVDRCLFYWNEPYLHRNVEVPCVEFIPNAQWGSENPKNCLFIQSKLKPSVCRWLLSVNLLLRQTEWINQ